MKPATLIPKGYWICACVKRNKARDMVAIKHNAPNVKRCRSCGTTKAQSDAYDAKMGKP